MKFPPFLISPFDIWTRSRPERAHVGIRREWRIETLKRQMRKKCTSVAFGKNATADGSVLMAHNEDGEDEELSGLVAQIPANTKNKNYSSNTTNQAKVKEYEDQIDQMVYQLYGLTPEEIAVVESQKA